MNNFWTRTLTGAVFVAIMIGGIWWSYWSMAFLFFVIIVLGLWEFYSLVEQKSIQKVFGILLGISIFAAIILSNAWLFSYYPALAILFLSATIIIAELFLHSQKPFSNIAFAFWGVIYISIPFSLLTIPTYHVHLMMSDTYSPDFLLGYFFLLWSNDTFAYLVGIAIGKHKLFERISPKKTWEGFAGGIICTIGIASVISVFFTELTMIQWMIVSLIVSVFGTLGDLVESMFKRSLGVKDSGTILPGHGGILDRFDGVLLSSPFVVTYLLLIR